MSLMTLIGSNTIEGSMNQQGKKKAQEHHNEGLLIGNPKEAQKEGRVKPAKETGPGPLPARRGSRRSWSSSSSFPSLSLSLLSLMIISSPTRLRGCTAATRLSLPGSNGSDTELGQCSYQCRVDQVLIAILTRCRFLHFLIGFCSSVLCFFFFL